jgi:molybdopterin synthase sulfur carrier subunit
VAALRVRCVFLQEFYKMAGRFEVEIELSEGSTVGDLIDYIDRELIPGFKERVVEGGRPKWPVEIAVNGRRIEFLEGLSTKLRHGDRVLFSPRAFFVL